ncbi:MAG: galactose mutarotase [Bernardetiaceae bacterium]|nr:galactose mutarotase [Bernardetiaceae bacterium]
MFHLFPRAVCLGLLLGTGWLAACQSPTNSNQREQDMQTDLPDSAQNPRPQVTSGPWGRTDGLDVRLYTLTNAAGATVKITNYGAAVTHLLVPDRQGQLADVTLGFDSLVGYQSHPHYFGAIVGRYGNRIAKGKASLYGRPLDLAPNNAPNHLHGGRKGFDKVVWQAAEFTTDSTAGLKLTYASRDGEEGYPGNLQTEVTYTWGPGNSLRIDYQATTDQPTVVNLTNHAYFNLSGQLGNPVLEHQLQINAARFLPVDATLIPTGELKPVQGTPFDFTQPRAIGQAIGQTTDEQIKRGGGYDHCWALDGPANTMRLVATAYEPTSGRMLEVLTTEPGLQFYSGNFLNGKIQGKGGIAYPHRAGFCLETQHYPDSPNRPDFPPTSLRPGETYRSTTVYRFSTR